MPHYKGLLHFARQFDSQEAEDLVQQAYLQALIYFPRFRGDSNGMFSLLATCVRRCFAERFKHYGKAELRRHTVSLDDVEARRSSKAEKVSPRVAAALIDSSTPESLAIAHEAREIAKRLVGPALAALPPERAALVRLVYWDDLSYETIAADTGLWRPPTAPGRLGQPRKTAVSVHSVRLYSFAARQQMRQFIETAAVGLALAIRFETQRAEKLAAWRKRHAAGRRHWEAKRAYATRSWAWQAGNAATRAAKLPG
jgi:RNA polymerase sigma factor (sigma-70 family)